MSLAGKPFELHLAGPLHPSPAAPLVLYASGDGGWFGAAVDMFRTIAADGYPTVGISSKAFMKLAHRTPLKPETLTAEYLAILARAREALGLAADTPVVLTGWSRGASLAVITAAQPIARPAVRGVVAIGLTHGEDLKVDGEADETDDDPVTAAGASTDRRDDTLPPVRHDEVDTYALLRGLAPIRSAVIQATHDHYLPAAQARRLFGAETTTRRFFAIEARNHRFSGGKADFDAALTEALHWAAD